MDINSSISYRRFLNDYYQNFKTKHFNDIIDFLEKVEDHRLDQYLNEAEIAYEVETKFSYIAATITSELGLDQLGSSGDSLGTKVYDDVVKMIKAKLKEFILESSAYYHLASRIN